MSTPKKWTFLLFILFYLNSFFTSSFAQSLDIQICPLEYPSLSKSLVCISSIDGTSLYEHVLTNEEITNGLTVSQTVIQGSPSVLTILNEYLIDSINEGKPFIKAVSYYDIEPDIKILKFDHPTVRPFLNVQIALLSILNCPPIEKYIFHSKSPEFSHWKLNGDKLWANASFKPGEDVFVVLKAKNDPRLRYIYLTDEDIPVLSDPVSINDAITLDWRHLPTDLQEIEVPLPFNEVNDGYIRALNNQTNNICTFFSSKTIPPSEKTIKIYIPSTLNFYDFDTNLNFITGNENGPYAYRYHLVHGKEIVLPKFEPELIQVEQLRSDSTSVSATISSYTDFFKLDYYKGTGAKFGPGKNLLLFKDSNWEVYGKNKRSIEFVFPKLSQTSISEFQSMKSEPAIWRLRHFEMIKLLEKTTSIDWINFLAEYNLLYVKARLQ